MTNNHKRHEQLEEWIFQLRLTTKQSRIKALEHAKEGTELYDYYKGVINRNKYKGIQNKTVIISKY